MERKSSGKQGKPPLFKFLLELLLERLLYVLITAVLCSVPFLVPGITIKQGTVYFFGGAMAVFLILMFFGMWSALRDSWKDHESTS